MLNPAAARSSNDLRISLRFTPLPPVGQFFKIFRLVFPKVFPKSLRKIFCVQIEQWTQEAF